MYYTHSHRRILPIALHHFIHYYTTVALNQFEDYLKCCHFFRMLKYSTNLTVLCYFFLNIQTFTPYLTRYTHRTFSQLLLQYKSTLNFFILIFSFFPIWNSVFHFPSLLSISLISLWELLNISHLFYLDTHVAYKVIFLFYFYFKLFCNVWFLLLYKF